jgi:hypothetical protein
VQPQNCLDSTLAGRQVQAVSLPVRAVQYCLCTTLQDVTLYVTTRTVRCEFPLAGTALPASGCRRRPALAVDGLCSQLFRLSNPIKYAYHVGF